MTIGKMKKLLIILFLPFLVLGQEPEFKFEDNLMAVVFYHKGISSETLYSKCLASISNVFSSSKYVIDLDDRVGKKIIMNANTLVSMDNNVKMLYPRMKEKFVPESLNMKLSYRLNIDFKDDRYRMVFEITDVEYYDYDYNALKPLKQPSTFVEDYSNDNELKETLITKTKGTLVDKQKKQLYVESWFKNRSKWINDLQSKAKSIVLLINDGISENPLLKGNSILNDDF